MSEITPEVRIEGVSVDYIDGTYQSTGGLTAATLQFKLPKSYAGYKDLWNKEVTLHFTDFDKPLFRGYIKRIKANFDDVEIFSQDILGYMVKGGNPEKAKISLTDFWRWRLCSIKLMISFS